MIRNSHNPFADPTLITWVVLIVSSAVILKSLLNWIAKKIGLWRLTVDARISYKDA